MVNSPGWATLEIFKQSTRSAEDIKVLSKGLQELTQPVKLDDGEA
jgi:hypothetical protein